MKLSVVICTYRRSELLNRLLQSLASQTLRDFEVLVVDGGGEGSISDTRRMTSAFAPHLHVKVMASAKGLTKQRNMGLRSALGETICFFDDDVAFAPDFLAQIDERLSRPEMAAVGGLTAYDTVHYPQQMNLRWRLRRLLRVVPSLRAGAISRLGASVPISFSTPFSGSVPVGYFYGFCMIFRKSAIKDIWFDEDLPTYGGEDRDFSFRVSRACSLVLCGDLKIEHFQSPQSRDSLVQRTYQTGFGAGRTFAKHQQAALDYVSLAWAMLCEFCIDSLAFFQKPSAFKIQMPFARLAGTFAGIRSKPPRERNEVLKPLARYQTRVAE